MVTKATHGDRASKGHVGLHGYTIEAVNGPLCGAGLQEGAPVRVQFVMLSDTVKE